MNRFALYLCLGVVFLLTQPPAWAEDHQGGTKPQSSATERPDQDSTRLKTKEANLLSAVFRLPVPVVNDLYGEAVPKAITKAINEKKEREISVILADLMGTLNDRQMETLVATVETELEEEKEQENRDDRYIALMERLLWAGRIMVGDPVKNENSEGYNKSFNDAFAARREKSKLIYQKMQDAMAGNEAAKKFLKENLNRRSVLAFIDAQRKSGNTKLANDLTDALSTKVGNEKVLDTFANRETQRLKLGPTRDSMEKAIQAYSDRNGGLHNVALAAAPHKSPRRTFKVNTNGTVNVTENRPRPKTSVASRPKTAKEDKSEEKPAPKKRVAAGPQPQPKKRTTPSTGSSGPDISQLQSMVSNKCQGCHGTTLSGSSAKNARISVDGGGAMSLSAALGKVNGNPQMASVAASDKALLQKFARAQ